MSKHVLLNAHTWAGEYEFSADLNATALDYSADLQDATTFGVASMQRLGGLKDVSISMDGYVEADTQDAVSFGKLGIKNVPVSVSPDGMVGNTAYFFRADFGQYNPGATIGEILAFTFSGEASGGDGLVRGVLSHEGTESTSDTGAAQQLGAVTAGQKLYAAVHVMEASGGTPTLDIEIESDDAAGMASPVTQITIPQFTDVGSAWGTATGAIADDYFRVKFTVGGTTPSFKFVVLIGVK